MSRKIDKILNNKKIGMQPSKDSTHGCPVPRFYWKKGKQKESASVLVKCGCCDEKVRIYLGLPDNMFEINGVLAHREIWQKLFKEIDLI